MISRRVFERKSKLENTANTFKGVGKKIILSATIFLAAYLILTEINSCTEKRPYDWDSPPELKYQNYC
jgi:hypothetical protein